MSSIPITKKDGDVTIGRNARIGGSVSVERNATISGNVKIEGWLDAKNIKGPNKGQFLKVTDLRVAYPMPHDGWWAIVGAALPGDIYIGHGGEWVATGEKGGNPTIDSSQYSAAVEDLQSDITTLSADVTKAQTTADNATQLATNAGVAAAAAQITANEAKSAAAANKTAIDNLIGNSASEAIDTFNEILAFLEGVKDNEKLTGKLNEIRAHIEDINVSLSTLEDADIILDDKIAAIKDSLDQVTQEIGIIEIYGIAENLNDEKTHGNPDTQGQIIFVRSEGLLYRLTDDNYPSAYGQPSTTDVYRIDNNLYHWNGTYFAKFVDENELDALQDNIGNAVSYLTFINADTIAHRKMSLGDAIYEVAAVRTINLGDIIMFRNEDNKWVSYQYVGYPEDPDADQYTVDAYKVFGGSAVGNCYNVTVEQPKPTGEYYATLDEAIEATFNAGVAALGLQVTFALTASTWKTYQYIGVNVSKEQFIKPANWLDLAGMSAGAEPLINVNELCGNLTGGQFYDLSTATNAITNISVNSGIEYRKPGLVLTYMVAENTWETKKFHGQAIADFKDFGLWKEEGGGNDIETSDAPAEDGKDAFSTGGAYAQEQKFIADFEQSEDEDNLYFQGLNTRGVAVGSQIKVPKSSGTGVQGGSSLSIFMESEAVYGAFGSTLDVRLAIKSVKYDGADEILGTIDTISIYDAITNLPLYTERVETKSSTTATDYKFTLDFSPYFTAAQRRDFIIVATDRDNNVRRRTITVTAVDVTCTVKGVQDISDNKSIVIGQRPTPFQLYKFANNVSRQGVRVAIDIFIDGEWKQLNDNVVTDTFSKNITINPADVFGDGTTQLTHGSYALRIKGTDIASGVVGNTVYTSVMVVDPAQTAPIVTLRFDDSNNGTIRLYDHLSLDIAAYTPGKTESTVSVVIDGETTQSLVCNVGNEYNYSKQVQGYEVDGSSVIKAYVQSGTAKSQEVKVTVKGSAIGAVLKAGALFGYDFSGRSNSEPTHDIENNGFKMDVVGSNWSSNGFVDYLGERCLAIKENVTASIPHTPFASAATEKTQGCAIQFAFATANIKDPEAKLIECYDPTKGAGFYITGNEIVMTCATGSPQKVTRPFQNKKKITVAFVVEPSTIYVTRGDNNEQKSTIKLYIDGEEVGCIGYTSNSNAIMNENNIKFNGVDGDFYLYYYLAYESHYEWAQAFKNYLCKLTDTPAMIAEYEAENVLDNQNRPSLELLKEKKIPYYVVVAPQATFNSFDSDINTSTKFTCTLFYFDPKKPWRSFKATNVQWRRQGTTSAKRPIKNDRFYLKKPVNKTDTIEITPMYVDEYPDGYNEEVSRTYALFRENAVQVEDNSIPVSIITVKVDYSDSSNANDCGVCDMMNATFRALGPDYMTPAQRAFDGTWKGKNISLQGLQMNHSTANHPIAAFRSTMESLSDAWFHAKGNWKEDKGEQVALGFQKTPGYNKGCLNYGDFIEFFGNKGETLDQIEARFKSAEGLDTESVYLLSLYCGRDYRFMRYQNGAWVRTTGSMKQVGGKWVVTGDVLNPVSGYELLTYSGLDWWQGVKTIDDMMEPRKDEASWVTKLDLKLDTYPAWTYYFECMIDDDQLQEDLARGKKVPYELFNMLRFCDSVDYAEAAIKDADGNFVGVDQTKFAALAASERWRTEAWKYLSVQSLMSYYTFTDYLAAVDQQAKNMQPMFFLEDGCSVENGVYKSAGGGMEPIRMYFNKVYDCDTCNGQDNDGGNTIPALLDPANDTHCYAGRGSVLWNNLRCQQEMVTDINGNTLNLPGVVSAMRSLPELPGVGGGPFSPQGAYYYFLTKRILTWPKVVVSYDGEHKYINYTGYNDDYFYALQGSRRSSLPRFIEQRWRIRDGYYRCGDFKNKAYIIGARIGAKADSVIKFRAAQDAYFGIGNDSGNVSEGFFLRAGEEGTFSNFPKTDSPLIYIYNADLMSELDLSQISLDGAWKFSAMSLVERLIIGGEDHATWYASPGNTGDLLSIDKCELPFLRELDIRGTKINTVNATSWPRLEKLLATDTDLTTLTLAETAPVSELTLPATITRLDLINLPQLTYPGGLQVESFENVTRVMLSGCPNIDQLTLLEKVLQYGKVRNVRFPNVNITAPASLLQSLRTAGAVGLDPDGHPYTESGQCSGVTGRWILSSLIDDAEVDALQAYFPNLELHNAQYSTVVFDDANEDSQNITNLENGTTGPDYEPSGHFVRIEQGSHAYRCIYDASDPNDPKMLCEQMSDADYNHLANGSEIDPSDQGGIGYDIMKRIQPYWYKGVNDFKNQKKYLLVSSLETEPLSTTTKVVRHKLADLLVQEMSCVYTTVNSEPLKVGDTYPVAENSANNVYAMDIEGMTQVRWPGVNQIVVSGQQYIGTVFVDADDKVIDTFNLIITHALCDFVPGDYVFCNVPKGAKRIVFTAPAGFDDLECIAVDSPAIEAIEPDWVHTHDRLVGVYGLHVDGLRRARSISNVKTQTGDGTSQTNTEWKYDADGNPTNIPSSTIHYTAKDCMNICEARGKGFQAIDYEMSKDIANLVMALTGERNIQIYAGQGCSSSYTTGNNNANTFGNVTRKGSSSGQLGNIIFGIQNFVACNFEWMTNIAANVVSWESFKRNKCTAINADPIDQRFHIYDPVTKTERVVSGRGTSGYCVGRVKFGRFADVIASRTTNDNSLWNRHYTDAYWYNADRGRVVGRANSSANASGGLVFSHANHASSNSNAFSGSRLAFSGKIVITESEPGG